MRTGFSEIEPTTLTLPKLKTDLPQIEFSKTQRHVLNRDELQLSHRLSTLFPTIQSIEASIQPTDNQEVMLNFLVRSMQPSKKGPIEELFSFSVVSSESDAAVLPDLLEIKQASEEDIYDDPVAKTVGFLMVQIATHTLERINHKQTPKEKPTSTNIKTVIATGLTGTTRQPQIQTAKKSKPTPQAKLATNPESIKTHKALLTADNLTDFDLSRFGMPVAEVVESIQRAIAHWNEHGNLGQSRVRSQKNRYRIACTVGKTPLRIFFEMQPDQNSPLGKKLVIIDIRKRNENTYKHLK